jgi:hypothetical protein
MISNTNISKAKKICLDSLNHSFIASLTYGHQKLVTLSYFVEVFRDLPYIQLVDKGDVGEALDTHGPTAALHYRSGDILH